MRAFLIFALISSIHSGEVRGPLHAPTADPEFRKAWTGTTGAKERQAYIDHHGGAVLESGEFIASRNRKYFATFLHNGDLVICTGRSCSPGDQIWSSNRTLTSSSGKQPFVLILKYDNHLCIYDRVGEKRWDAHHTNDIGARGAQLVMRDDGDLVVIEGSGTVIWSSFSSSKHTETPLLPNDKNKGLLGVIRTLKSHISPTMDMGQFLGSPYGRYFASLESDGHLVIYNTSRPFKNAKPIWSSEYVNHWTGRQEKYRQYLEDDTDSNHPKYQLKLERNNELVIIGRHAYHSENGALWSSRTERVGKENGQCIMRDDGALVINDGAGFPIWSSRVFNGKKEGDQHTDVETRQPLIRSSCQPSTNDSFSHEYHPVAQGVSLFSEVDMSGAKPTCKSNISGIVEKDGVIVVLKQGECIASENQKYFVLLRPEMNGSLHICSGWPCRGENLLWKSVDDLWYNCLRSKSDCPDEEYEPPFTLKLKANNILVLYDNKTLARWQTQTVNKAPNSGGAQCIMTNYGDLELVNADLVKLWSSYSSPKHIEKNDNGVQYGLVGIDREVKQSMEQTQHMESDNGKYSVSLTSDGNLVIHHSSQPPHSQHLIWSSANVPHPPLWPETPAPKEGPFTLQFTKEFESLEIRNKHREMVWRLSAAHGNCDSHCVLRNDGVLVVRDTLGFVIWSSRMTQFANTTESQNARSSVFVLSISALCTSIMCCLICVCLKYCYRSDLDDDPPLAPEQPPANSMISAVGAFSEYGNEGRQRFATSLSTNYSTRDSQQRLRPMFLASTSTGGHMTEQPAASNSTEQPAVAVKSGRKGKCTGVATGRGHNRGR